MEAGDIIPTTQEQKDAAAQAAFEFLDEVMRDNLAGIVRRVYLVSDGRESWVYGYQSWPPLEVDGDPMLGVRSCTLDEFKAYLKDWYWPHARMS